MANLINCLETGQSGSPDLTRILDLSPIEKSRNEVIKHRSDLDMLVERPLLAACQMLYDKNVQTYSTSANKKDIDSGAYILIDYENLSSENKEVAEQYGKVIDYDNRKAVKIVFPVDEKTTVAEIESKSTQIASQFKHQKATWIPRFTFDEILLWVYGDLKNVPENHSVNKDDFVKDFNMFYDEGTDRFYYSREHFEKANQR